MKTCFVDYRISEIEEMNLKNLGVNIIKVPKHKNLYEAIDGHPDIQINILNSSSIIISKNSCKELFDSIPNNITVLESSLSLERKYPKDIYLNAVNLKNIFIHNLKYTDPNLLENVKHKNLIDIKQGYAKCSIAVVSENAFITSDEGVYNSLKESNFDVLLIPSGDILLPGLNYGFIGGTCGLISEREMVFFGNLENHSYGKEILNFLKKHNVKAIYLSNGKLIDRGSILAL